MKGLFLLLSLLFLLGGKYCFAQTEELVDNKVDWANRDTAYYVRYGAFMDSDPPKYQFNLDIKGYGNTTDSVKIDWGCGKDTTVLYSDVTGGKILSPRYNVGAYELRVITFEKDPGTRRDTIHRIVFNKRLEGSVSIKGFGSANGLSGCMEHGVDTFVLKVNSAIPNPPRTRYTVNIVSKQAGVEWASFPGTEGTTQDSFLIVFSGATGMFDTRFQVEMTYQDLDGKPKHKITATTPTTEAISIYKTPDLKEMFNFGDTIDPANLRDTLIRVCYPQGKTDKILYDSQINQKYMTSWDEPDYTSRSNFRVDFYRADSVNGNWGSPVRDINIVDTTGSDFIFKADGFYKINMVASNKCGADTLWTDSIRNSTHRRYIQVYERAGDSLVCRNNKICMNANDTIYFIDKNSRSRFVPPPLAYNFETYIVDKSGTAAAVGSDYFKKVDSLVYLNGKIMPDGAHGCDSTVIKAIVKEPGKYLIKLTRVDGGTDCGDIVKAFNDIIVGKKPFFLRSDSVTQSLIATNEFGSKYEHGNLAYLQHCDTFHYTLPDLSTVLDSNNFQTDSIRFYLSKGSRIDTIVWKPGTTQTYRFDSVTDGFNYIRTQVYNVCGTSEMDSVAFYTYTQPNVTLWRDSLPDNDTLCAEFNYPYYLHGVLPANAVDTIIFSESVNISSGSVDANKKIPFKQGMQVGHKAIGKIYEEIIIKNKSYLECRQLLRDTVQLVTAPDTLIYRDSIRYCESQTELNTEKLFDKTSDRTFFSAIWTMPYDNTVKTGKDVYPLINFSTTAPRPNDTLAVRISNGGGCFVKDTLIFIPKPEPVVTTPLQDTVCVIDTLYSDVSVDFLSSNAGTKGVVMGVYVEKYKPENLIYHTDRGNANTLWRLTTSAKDTINLIYHFENKLVDTTFGACSRIDTLLLRVLKPKLHIKKKDTIQGPAYDNYDFSRLFTAKAIDTSHLIPGRFKWSVKKGETAGLQSISADSLYGWKYNVGATDTDSLVFQLRGMTLCGGEIYDSLIVYIPKAEIFGDTDTICSNTENYILWGADRTWGKFIDTTTLKWEIIDPLDGRNWGSLSPASKTGASVTYTPSSDLNFSDSVRIKVTGSYGGIATLGQDTVYLRVNKAPEYTFSLDTLLAKDHIVKVRHIKGMKINNYSNLTIGYVTGDGTVEVDSIFSFVTDFVGTGARTLMGKAEIKVSGLRGCADLLDTVVLKDLSNVKVEFPALESCEGDCVGLDTVMRYLYGKDKYVKKLWNFPGVGGFNADTTSYCSQAADDGKTITLKVFKAYYAYDSSYVSTLGSTYGVGIVIHKAPVLTFTHDTDTLCNSLAEIAIPSSWMTITPVTYKDSLLYNGGKLTGGKYTFTKTEGQTDTVVVTVNQGTCKKWQSVSDTLYLYQLPQMTGSFTLDDICEDKTTTVKSTLIDPLAKDYFWTVVGGTLNTVGSKQYPVFKPDNKGKQDGAATVTLNIIPPRACTSADTAKIDYRMNIFQLPQLTWRDTTVCGVLNDAITIPVKVGTQSRGRIQKIEWYPAGKTSENIATIVKPNVTEKLNINYVIKASDITAGFVNIVAKLTSDAPCDNSPVYDTIKMSFQPLPKLTQVIANPAVCQGDSLLLTNVVKIANLRSDSVWSINTGGGTISTSGKYYLPANSTGAIDLKYTVTGKDRCNGKKVVQSVTVTINEAPVPSITTNVPLCSSDAITFSAPASHAVQAYTWNFGDDLVYVSGTSVQHRYNTHGKYTVTVDAEYLNSCHRTLKQEITVNQKPTALFDLPALQVAVGKEVNFVNKSVPASSIVNSTWMVEGTLTSKGGLQNHKHTFNTENNGYPVKLEVVSDKNCRDTLTKFIDVVMGPGLSDFRVIADPCTGVANFTYTIALHGASVLWDFGNGQTSNDPALTGWTYTRYAKDTLFKVKLTLTNAADTVSDSLDVRLVSTLASGLEILPDPSGCHQIVKKISNKIVGHSDWSNVDWGDGSPLLSFDGNMIKVISHRYENTTVQVQKYPITVTAGNACVDTVSATDTIKIYPATVSAIIKQAKPLICFDSENGYKNKSIGFDPVETVWDWKFEPGHAYEQHNVDSAVHLFEKPGTYWVKLRVKDQCNEAVDSVKVIVDGNDSIYFDVLEKPYCAGQDLTIKFIQKGSPEFSALKWDIFDNNGIKLTSSTSTQLISRFEAGKYTIDLQGKANGCDARISRVIEVNRTPSAAIAVLGETSGCLPFEVQFMASDNNHLTPAPTVVWDFKDGAFSGNARETNIFKTGGTYDVKLTLTSDVGCVNTETKQVTALDTPRISFSVDHELFCTQNGNFEVNPVNTSQDMNISNFIWWSDGQQITLNQNPGKLLFTNKFGEIHLKLTATHQINGCPAKYEKTIVASPKVSVSVEMDRAFACENTAVKLTASSEEGNTFAWDLGDGSTSTENSFEHIYETVGKYTMSLIAANRDGCKDTVVQSVQVYPLPVADFTWEKDNTMTGFADSLKLPDVENGGIKFKNYSYVKPDDWGTVFESRWDFGDSSAVYIGADAAHRYGNNGLYKVWLKVKTAYNCVDSTSDIINIAAVKGLFIPNAFAPAMDDEGMNRFEPKGIGIYTYKIQVYDYWGTCVWSSDKVVDGKPGEYWDGTFNGSPLPKGDYLWKVSAIFKDGTVWDNSGGSTQGHVVLIR